MTRNQVLRLIEQKSAPSALKRTVVELWPQEPRAMHSLHYVMNYHASFRPELPNFFIRRYSQEGDVVLDPFSGRGTTALEANLLGRVAYASDLNPIATLCTHAKTLPVGLDEVVLRLNEIDFARPVDMSEYQEGLGAFYSPDTFRELVHLRNFLTAKRDRVNRFIELLALSRLHGHTPGYFSVYTAPQRALSARRQLQLNLRRREIPQYRAVVPRIIRRAAQVLQDGFSQDFFEIATKNSIEQGDARNMYWVNPDSVDLVVTAPPLPECVDYEQDQWLEYWFSGFRAGRAELYHVLDLAYWKEFIAATLREMLRVLKPGGYASLAVGEVQLPNGVVYLDDVVAQEVQRIECNGKKFRVDEVLIHQQRVSERVPGGESGENVVLASNRIVVLRAAPRTLKSRARRA